MPYITKVLAQNQLPNSSQKPQKKPDSRPLNKTRLVFVWPKTPPNLSGISGRFAGNASRQDFCAFNVKLPLTAVAPVQNQNVTIQQKAQPNEIRWGLTTV
ncbi:hypothetical protein [Fortiea contorta]|uniref:hypothetical protein n=1 Tax=Fortiea contorta TaxID=1892405 RepID=UPI00034AE3E9|nr:hypothetical protein [Fortiea contorta]